LTFIRNIINISIVTFFHSVLLSVADLDVLLVWHQAPKTKGAKKADNLQQWMAIRPDGDPPPAYERWTDEEEQRLLLLLLMQQTLISATHNTGVRWR